MTVLLGTLFGVDVYKSKLVPQFQRIRGKRAHAKQRQLQRIVGYRVGGAVSANATSRTASLRAQASTGNFYNEKERGAIENAK